MLAGTVRFAEFHLLTSGTIQSSHSATRLDLLNYSYEDWMLGPGGNIGWGVNVYPMYFNANACAGTGTSCYEMT